jgi:hypothetical protein
MSRLEPALPDACEGIPAEELHASEEGDEAPPDEAGVAAFGQLYESQPAEWIELMDALGRRPRAGGVRGVALF